MKPTHYSHVSQKLIFDSDELFSEFYAWKVPCDFGRRPKAKLLHPPPTHTVCEYPAKHVEKKGGGGSLSGIPSSPTSL